MSWLLFDLGFPGKAKIVILGKTRFEKNLFEKSFSDMNKTNTNALVDGNDAKYLCAIYIVLQYLREDIKWLCPGLWSLSLYPTTVEFYAHKT